MSHASYSPNKPEPTQEQLLDFLERVKAVGIPVGLPDVTDERKEEIVRYFRENPPVDYLGLMK